MQINWSEQTLLETENIVNYIAEHNVVAECETRKPTISLNSISIIKP